MESISAFVMFFSVRPFKALKVMSQILKPAYEIEQAANVGWLG